MHLKPGVSQEQIVFVLAVLLFGAFAALLPGFLSTQNVLSLLRSVAVLGVLGMAMVIVIIGRGIDLSIVANMAISVAWTFQLANNGMPLGMVRTTYREMTSLRPKIRALLLTYIV